MNWFKNLKIRTKLLVSFTLVVILTLVVGIVGYFSLINVATNQNITYEDCLVPIRDLGYANASLLVVRGDVLAALGAKNNLMRKDYVESAKNKTNEVDELVEKYSKTAHSSEEKMLAQFKLAWVEYKKYLDEIYFLLLNNEDTEAADLIYGASLPYNQESRKNLRAMIDFIKQTAEELDTSVDADAYKAQTMIIVFVLSSITLAIFIGLYLSGFISSVVLRLKDATDKIINGDMNVTVEINSRDELGTLGANFNKMADKIAQQFDDIDKFGAPVMMIDKEFNITYMNLVGAELVGKSPKELIGKKCFDQFKTSHCKTDNCACFKAMQSNRTQSAETLAIPNGKEVPITYTGTPRVDKQGNVVGAMEFVTDMTIAKEQEKYLERSTNKILAEMEKFANGDLTVEVEPERNDDNIGKLFNGFNLAVTNIKEMINKVNEAVHATASASTQISSSSEEMAAGAQEQSSQTSEIATAIEQMTSTILQTTKNAGSASEQAKKSGFAAEEGGNVIKETIEGMNRIAEVVRNAAKTVQELGASSEQIGTIVQVIDDIADQTNLLALNAAIEAARAGEQGRGFAVVADEVRKLAERTTKATKEIGEMIRKIQKDTGGAVKSMELGTAEVEKGIDLAEKSGKSLKEIIGSTNNVVDVISQVAVASEEQSSAAEQISKSIEGINSVTQQSAAGVQQIARAAEDLNNLTVNLQDLVSQFNIDETRTTNNSINNKSEKSRLSVRSNGILVKS